MKNNGCFISEDQFINEYENVENRVQCEVSLNNDLRHEEVNDLECN